NNASSNIPINPFSQPRASPLEFPPPRPNTIEKGSTSSRARKPTVPPMACSRLPSGNLGPKAHALLDTRQESHNAAIDLGLRGGRRQSRKDGDWAERGIEMEIQALLQHA
ncbi:hypothetical protein HOY80DRAFT_952823, partial [Tuber brumale]